VKSWRFLSKDGQPITVRHARVQDAGELHQNFCAVVDEAEWLPTLRPNSNRSEWAEWIERTYSNREVLLIASLDEAYAGHLSLQPEEWNAALHVARLGIIVKKDARHRGVGRALMQAAEDAGRQQRYEKIVLSTFSTNTVARALYESLGYRTVGVRQRHFRMPKGYIDEVLMEKALL
jgi:ribosomal protein S18 acetylase RimI-like enzyme